MGTSFLSQNDMRSMMGYPSNDRYHKSAPNMYPPNNPVPFQPGGAPAYTLPIYAPQQSEVNSSSTLNHDREGHSNSSIGHNQGMYGTYKNNSTHDSYSLPNNELHYQQHLKPIIQETSDSSSFGRMMLIFMVILVSAMIMMSLAIWFLFGTYLPEFEVTSLIVSNFTAATNTTITGVWDATLTVRNRNDGLNVNSDYVRASIFYREVMMGMSSLQPFNVTRKNQSELSFDVSADPRISSDRMQNWLLPTLSNNGSDSTSVSFSLRMSMNASFTSGTLVYRQESLRILCERLQVIVLPTGVGTLSSSAQYPCQTRLREDSVSQL